MNQDAVLTLQKNLQSLGFDPGAIDGVFGPRTKAALMAFQKSKGLVSDGVVGPHTTRELEETVATSRESVLRLQKNLKSLGFDPGAIDGVMGPRTKAAIAAFQKSKGLVADGIVGPNTTRELEQALGG